MSFIYMINKGFIKSKLSMKLIIVFIDKYIKLVYNYIKKLIGVVLKLE
jgi:hypothetical protein